MIPGLTGFLFYDFFCRACGPLPEDFRAREMLRPLYPPLLVLFLANLALQLDFWFLPFLGACSISTAFCVVNRHWLCRHHGKIDRKTRLALYFLPPATPLLFCSIFQGVASLRAIPVTTAVCTGLVLAYVVLGQRISRKLIRGWAIPAGSIVAALLIAGLQTIGALTVLQPSKWMNVLYSKN